MSPSLRPLPRRLFALSTLAFALFAAGCRDGKPGSGKVITEARNVADFTAVELQGAYVVELQLGAATKLEITGDDNLVPLLETTVVDGRLVVKAKEPIAPKVELTLHLTTKDVSSIEADGAVVLRVRNIDNARLFLRFAGVSGGLLEGKTQELEAKILGAGGLDGTKLDAARVKLDLSGVGRVDVNATEELVADVSGAGSVKYGGNPKSVKKTVSGAGSVTAR